MRIYTKKGVLNCVITGVVSICLSNIAAANTTNYASKSSNKLTNQKICRTPDLCNPIRRTLCNFDYYVGFDLKRRRIPYEKNLGSNIMPKVIPEYGVFVGVKFNEYFGLEFGYEWSKKVKGKKTVEEYGWILGEQVEDDFTEHHEIKYKRKGYSIHAVLYSPTLVSSHLQIQTFIALGIQQHQHLFKSTVIIIDGIDPDLPDTKNQHLVSHKRKFYIPEAKFGFTISHETSNIVVKPYISWSKTSKLGKFTDDLKNDDKFYSVKHRNSTALGISMAIKI